MSIALCRARLRVAEQLADDGETKTSSCTNTCMGMSQIVKANAIEAGALRHEAPGAIKIVAWHIRIVAHDHKDADPRKFR